MRKAATTSKKKRADGATTQEEHTTAPASSLSPISAAAPTEEPAQELRPINDRIPKGPARKYTAESLAKAFEEFVQWAVECPLMVSTATKSGKVIQYGVRRPLTVQAFARYSGISTRTFYDYAEKEDMADACEMITDAIKADQLEGGLANMYNAMIVARVLKLRDIADITTDGKAISKGPQSINVTYKEGEFSITADDI